MFIEFNPGNESQMDVVIMNGQEKSAAAHNILPSPEVSTSISEFLEQERLCKELCTTIASDGIASSVTSIEEGRYTRCDSALNISDLSDDDIGSILEKMSQIMSPSKSSQGSGSLSNSLYDTKTERNIEEILEEAEILMQGAVTAQPPGAVNQTLLAEPPHSYRAQSPIGRTVSALSPNHTVNYSRTVDADIVSHQTKTDKVSTNLVSRTKGSVKEMFDTAKTKDRSVRSSSGRSTSSVSDSLSNCDQFSEASEKNLRRSDKANQRNNKALDGTQHVNVVNLNETYLIKGQTSESKVSDANTRNTLVRVSSKSSKLPVARNTVVNPGSADILNSYKNTDVPKNSREDSSIDSEEKCFREFVSKGPIKSGEEYIGNIPIDLRHETLARKTEEIYEKINEEIRVEIEQVLKSKSVKLDDTPVQTPILNGDFPNLKLSYPGLETPSGDVPSCFNLETEFLEERKRCLKLKADLEWIGRLHMEEVSQMQKQHDEDMFSLKKEIVTLTAQLSERVQSAPAMDSLKECERHKVEMLEKEMAEQEVLLAGYQRENELLCAELRSVKRLLKKLMSLLRKDT